MWALADQQDCVLFYLDIVAVKALLLVECWSAKGKRFVMVRFKYANIIISI
jgi:hypothetical protein